MTDKYIQVTNNSQEPLVTLAKTLEKQADNIRDNHLKKIEQNISALSGFLDKLGVGTDS